MMTDFAVMWGAAIGLWSAWTVATRENDSVTLQLAGLTALAAGRLAPAGRRSLIARPEVCGEGSFGAPSRFRRSAS